jgi:tetratricopeptide (TPR) repeat protein
MRGSIVMPTTVNGVGTHYYGKKNRTVRTAPCRSCGRVANLESYDTRLWFVIIFIPIIPLGRKRVIDSCPVCTRHFVADADKYEESRQLQVSGAQDQFRRDPSPQAALQVHGTLLGFHETEQATKFRQVVRERYPADAELMAALAAQLEQVASYKEATELYEAAYRLQPELPEARVAIAMRKITAGELDEARRLLDFLEVQGAGEHYPLGPLDVLSTYYQKQGRHEEALEMAEHLLREVPAAGQQHKFRAFVARSEKALGRIESILPRREHSLRGLFRGDGHVYSRKMRWAVIGGAGLLLLAAGLAVNNEYIRRHRTLRVINACGAPVQVRVDDQPPQTVADSGQVVVEEGRHRIQVTGAVDETHDVALRAGYFDRWFSKPAWVLIPGGEAALAHNTLYYATNPAPSRHELIVGRPFVALPHVDYAFEEPPRSLEVKGNGTVVKVALQRSLGGDVQVFHQAAQTDRAGALTFAERRLRRHPEDQALLRAYYIELEPGEYSRAESFLKSGLDRRPVSIPWHRLYQNFAERDGQFDALMAAYDGFLAAEPRNASLMYLRGRIEADPGRQEGYYRRAIAADPKLAWPWEALAVRAAAARKWDECLRHVGKARELKIDENAVEEAWIAARIATGGAKELASEYRARLSANPMDFDALRNLCEATAASAAPEEAERELTACLNRLPVEMREAVSTAARSVLLYETGKLKECEELCGRAAILRDSLSRLHTLLALKRTKEAVDDPALKKFLDEPWEMLAASLAWDLEGREAEAAEWRRRGLDKLERMGPSSRRAAAMLRSSAPPPVEGLSLVAVGPRRQALACALLAGRFPEKRSEYLAAAANYNFRRVPPYQLVRLAIAAPTAPKSPTTARR